MKFYQKCLFKGSLSLQQEGIGKEMLHTWALDHLRKKKEIDNVKEWENSLINGENSEIA